MAKWLASDVPEWLCMVAFLVGLPVLMLLLQVLVHRVFPHWRRGEHNDAAGVMLSAAVVVYSVAIGLCIITLWEKREEARSAVAAEASNLAAVADGSRVCAVPVQQRIRALVVDYNRDVVSHWQQRVRGEGIDAVGVDLTRLAEAVGQLEPETAAQRAYVDDAVARLARATELRATSLRLAQEQQLPGVLWLSVLGGSVVVLALCLTCGVRDGALRRLLLAGVAATVGINLFLVVELNYPFYGSIRVGPESYTEVVTNLKG